MSVSKTALAKGDVQSRRAPRVQFRIPTTPLKVSRGSSLRHGVPHPPGAVRPYHAVQVLHPEGLTDDLLDADRPAALVQRLHGVGAQRYDPGALPLWVPLVYLQGRQNLHFPFLLVKKGSLDLGPLPASRGVPLPAPRGVPLPATRGLPLPATRGVPLPAPRGVQFCSVLTRSLVTLLHVAFL